MGVLWKKYQKQKLIVILMVVFFTAVWLMNDLSSDKKKKKKRGSFYQKMSFKGLYSELLGITFCWNQRFSVPMDYVKQRVQLWKQKIL